MSFESRLERLESKLNQLLRTQHRQRQVTSITKEIVKEKTSTAPPSGVIDADVLLIGDGSERTISSGVITINYSYHIVDTESDAESDYLDKINGATDNNLLFLRPADDGRSVIIRNNQFPGESGNILLTDAGSITLNDTSDLLLLKYDSVLNAWLQVTRYTDTQAVSAVEAESPELNLDATTLRLGAGSNSLASRFYIKMGQRILTRQMLYIDVASATNTTEECIAVEAIGDYVVTANRNSNNVVATWETNEHNKCTQLGIVRGAGSPNYLQAPVVVDVDDIDNPSYAVVAAYRFDNSVSIIDISDPENPFVIKPIRDDESADYYLSGVSSVFWDADRNQILATSMFDSSMLIFDVTDVENPVLTGGVRGSTLGGIPQEVYNGSTWAASGVTNYLYGASDVYVQVIGAKVFALVASRMDGSLTVFDITNPSSISRVSYDWHKLSGTDYHELAGALGVQVKYHTTDAKYYVYVGTRFQHAQVNENAPADANGRTGWSAEWHTGNRRGSVVIYSIDVSGNLTYMSSLAGRAVDGSGVYLSEVHWIRYGVLPSGKEVVVCPAFGDDALTLVDVDNKSSPSILNYVSGVGSPYFLQGAVGLDLITNASGEVEFVAVVGYFDHGFVLYDVRNVSSVVAPSQMGGRAGSNTIGDPFWMENSHSIKYTTNGHLHVVARGGSDSFNVFTVEKSIYFTDTPADTFTDADINNINRMRSFGTDLYAASFTGNKLVALDLSDCTNILKHGSLGGSGSPNYMSGIIDVAPGEHATLGKRCVYASSTDNAIGLVDITTPGAMGLLGVTQNNTVLNQTFAICTNSAQTRAYVAAYSGYLSVWDISTNTPTLLNYAQGSGEPAMLSGARGICLYNSEKYCAVVASGDSAVSFWDIENVSASITPVKIKDIHGSGAPSYLGSVRDIYPNSDVSFLYAVSRNDDALIEIDVSDPDRPYISNVILGIDNDLDGALGVKVKTIQNVEIIICAAFDGGTVTVFKKSDFSTNNDIGIKFEYGLGKVKSYGEGWSNL